MNISYKVKKSDVSIKQILKEKYEMSERLILKLKKFSKIKINQNILYIDYKIKENNILDIDLNFEETNENIVPNEKILINILYEDDYMLILDKPSRNTSSSIYVSF